MGLLSIAYFTSHMIFQLSFTIFVFEFFLLSAMTCLPSIIYHPFYILYLLLFTTITSLLSNIRHLTSNIFHHFFSSLQPSMFSFPISPLFLIFPPISSNFLPFSPIFILPHPQYMRCGPLAQFTELPFFASRVKLGKNGIEAFVKAELESLSEYEKRGLEGLKAELKGSIEKGIAFANKQPETASA